MAADCHHVSQNNVESKHEALADFIKNVHSNLRDNVQKANGNFQSVWQQHCDDKTLLRNYSDAMKELAVEHWHSNNVRRIAWCKQLCVEYFHEDGFKKCLRKECRRVLMNMEDHQNCSCVKEVERYQTILASSVKFGKLVLLDVGSCFNPFKVFPETFIPVAIDLCPGDKTVFVCDFLNLEICCKEELKKRPSSVLESECLPDYLQTCINGDHITKLPGGAFNVVVFCLLLSYLPAREQRWECCQKAHGLLQDGGLLLIVTPDSSHQNKNMKMVKSWQAAIEAIGFLRWKYHKDPHTHCMAFRKKSICKNLVEKRQSAETLAQMMYIHQDLKPSKDRKEVSCSSRTESCSEQVESLNELPFSGK